MKSHSSWILTKEQRQKAMLMRLEGVPISSIAVELKVSRTTVDSFLKKHFYGFEGTKTLKVDYEQIVCLKRFIYKQYLQKTSNLFTKRESVILTDIYNVLIKLEKQFTSKY